MDVTCGKCEHYRKKPFTTVFECVKYNKCLVGKPPLRCKECLEADKPADTPTKKSKKKEFIEVK